MRRLHRRQPRPKRREDFPFPIFTSPPVEEYGDADAAVTEPDPEVLEPTPQADESEWWTKPYKGGPMVKVPGFPRPLYPPDAAEKGKTPSKAGPDVLAYKRTVSRAGRWKPWEPDNWDEDFWNTFSHGRGTGMVGDSGIAGVQRQQGLDDTGWVGEKTFNTLRSVRVPTGPHEGEMAMDSVAVNLIEQAWQTYKGDPDPADIEDVKDAIYWYLDGCIDNASIWHYSQARAMTHLGREPTQESTCDCSGHSTGAYYMAKEETGIAVPDPNHNGYNGYGYTGTLINNPEVSGPYKIGDLALYGPSKSDTSHVVTCMLEGDQYDSVWCSMGSEEAPYAVELHYRTDLLCVVRPGLMP